MEYAPSGHDLEVTGVSPGWGRKRGAGGTFRVPCRRGTGIDRDGCRCRYAWAPSDGTCSGMHFDLMTELRNARIQRCHGAGRRTRPASWRMISSHDRGGEEPWARAGTCPVGDVWPAGSLYVGATGGSGSIGRGARAGRSVRSDRDPPFFRTGSTRRPGLLWRDGARASVGRCPSDTSRPTVS